MAHYAVLSPSHAGHLYPLGTLGSELVRRGHRVTVVSLPAAEPIVKELQLPLHPLDAERVPFRTSPVLFTAFRLARMEYNIMMRDDIRWQADMTLQLVPNICRELAVDGIIADQLVAAAGTVAEHAGLPFVTVCTAIPWNEDSGVPPLYTTWRYAEGPLARMRNRLGYAGYRWFCRAILATINGHRRRWGLSRFSHIDQTYSPLAQISQLFDPLELPRRQMPDVLHGVGSLAGQRQSRPDNSFPWEKLNGRPVIFASLGTIPDPGNLPVFRTILAACADLDATLVLALGKWSEGGPSAREHLGDPPRNAMLVDFAPQLALLDRASVMITHAGMNTMLEAIGRGVPMVALPRSADQSGNSTRIEHAGVGLRASFRRCRPAELRSLVERVLTDDRFRRRAKELQAAMRAAGGVCRAAEIAEQALTTRRPVKRPLECGDSSPLSSRLKAVGYASA
jgi:zeaxanthin glucosyltransferase